MWIPLRYVRILRALSRRWQRRVIFTVGAFAVGIAAVGLARAADGAQHAFIQVLHHARYAYFALTPLGFALIVWLSNRYFPNTQGSGIPQAIATRELKTIKERERFVSFRAGVGKVIMTLAALIVGASVGREGPTVQVGASLMFEIGKLTPKKQPGLILAGAAAGVAAAFNTPLAGIVFAIEEISRSFEVRTSGLIIGAVILAGITSMALIGDYTYFGSTASSLAWGTDWLVVPVCGVIGGLLGGGFGRLLILFAEGLPGAIGPIIKRHPIWFAGACGLGVAICGFLSGDLVFGTGYAQARSVVHAVGHLPWTFTPLKFIATVLSSVSGIPGGLFAPSLAVGAGFGADVARFFPSAPLGAVVLIGMVSYFAGVVQAPITSFVIVSEMVDNHQMLVPLMAAALIANACSKLVCREGVYHALAKRFLMQMHKPAEEPEPAPKVQAAA
ncbi:MAG TPA: chloride channel protein [Rhizomicrobium sp.]|nr:chloride channel protein [Rhizomicrobium sp.]